MIQPNLSKYYFIQNSLQNLPDYLPLQILFPLAESALMEPLSLIILFMTL